MNKVWVGLFVLAGCSSSSSGSTKKWIGSWVAALSENESCNGAAHTTALDGAFPIVQGTLSDEIVTQSSNGCDLTWTVSGSNAVLQAGQTCSVPGSAGGTWMPTFTDGNLAMSNGDIAVGDQGTAVLAIDSTTQSCTFTQSGTFTKD